MENELQCRNQSLYELNIPFVATEALLIVFICTGNILTIVTVWKTPTLRTVPNMYVVSLAVADLMVGGLAVPVQVIFFIPSLYTVYNVYKEFCLLGHILFIVSALSSIFSMAVIALDRAVYIGIPLHYNRLSTVPKAKLIIGCKWTFSLLVGTVPAYYNNWKLCRGCSAFRVIPKYYQVYVQVTLVAFVSIITAACYGFIFRIARSKQDSTRRLQADMKLVKTFVLVFGLFITCWAPLTIVLTIGHMTGTELRLGYEAGIVLSILNSGMNFLVYVVKNKNFRKAMIKLLCGRLNTSIVNPEQCTAEDS